MRYITRINCRYLNIVFLKETNILDVIGSKISCNINILPVKAEILIIRSNNPVIHFLNIAWQIVILMLIVKVTL